MSYDVQHELRFPLERDVSSPGLARQATRRTLIGWELPGLVEVVALTVSELVTNAVRYGRSPMSLVLRRSSHELCVEVHDAEPRMGATESDELATGGRGLDIVRAVATTTGVHEIPHDGKDVYATFRTN